MPGRSRFDAVRAKKAIMGIEGKKLTYRRPGRGPNIDSANHCHPFKIAPRL
jgi:hypothetical protein